MPPEEGNADELTMEFFLGIGHNRTRAPTRKKGNPTSTKKGGSSKLLCIAPFSHTKLHDVGHRPIVVHQDSYLRRDVTTSGRLCGPVALCRKEGQRDRGAQPKSLDREMGNANQIGTRQLGENS